MPARELLAAPFSETPRRNDGDVRADPDPGYVPREQTKGTVESSVSPEVTLDPARSRSSATDAKTAMSRQSNKDQAPAEPRTPQTRGRTLWRSYSARPESKGRLPQDLEVFGVKLEATLKSIVDELRGDMQSILRQEIEASNLAKAVRAYRAFEAGEAEGESGRQDDEDQEADVCEEWARRNVLVSRAQNIASHFKRGGRSYSMKSSFSTNRQSKRSPRSSHDIGSASAQDLTAYRARVPEGPAASREGIALLPDMATSREQLLPPADVGSARGYARLESEEGLLHDGSDSEPSISHRLARVTHKTMTMRESLDSTEFEAAMSGQCCCADYLEGVVMFLVVLNAITIGIETDYTTRSGADPFFWTACEWFFCCFYVMELAARFIMQGAAYWSNGWNVFDFIVVGVQVLELGGDFLGLGDDTFDVSFLRSFRIIRIIRVARMMGGRWPQLQVIEELRTLIFSIMGALSCFGWTLLLLGFLIYTVSICFTHIVFNHLERVADTEHRKELEYFYGSLGRTALTMFECIAGGISWDEAVVPVVLDISPWAGIMFCFYVAFCVFAVLNVVTGVFVERATMRTQDDKEEFLENQLTRVFNMADEDCNESVDWDEFQRRISTAEMQDFFRALDIDISEAKGIFQLLDADRSGSIDGVEFVSGCMRLQGNAKALEMRLLLTVTSRLYEFIKEKIAEIQKKLSQIDKVVRHKV